MSNWSKKIKAKSKLISLLRQIVVHEYDGSRLYNHVQSARDITTVEGFFFAARTIGKSEEIKKFDDLYQSEGDKYFHPVMGTVHSYLRKYDNDWYSTQKAFKE